MKVFELEFTYFDGCEWSQIEVNIKALTKIQLMKGFLKQTQFLHSRDLPQKIKVKEIWDSHKKYIEEKELKFPIITDSTLNY